MVTIVLSKKKRRRLIADASASRGNETLRLAAFGLIVFYNLVGVLDIISTTMAISGGKGEEANPFLRYLMDEVGSGWIIAKLVLQSVISMMVLWFPHPYVLALFAPAVAGNAVIVANNFLIAAGV
ncbi:MAG: DUF5658 family protein [Pseudomonadota bacterium]